MQTTASAGCYSLAMGEVAFRRTAGKPGPAPVTNVSFRLRDGSTVSFAASMSVEDFAASYLRAVESGGLLAMRRPSSGKLRQIPVADVVFATYAPAVVPDFGPSL